MRFKNRKERESKAASKSMGEFDEFDEFDDFQFDDAAIEQAISTAKVAPTPPKSQPLRPSPGKHSK